MPSEDYSWERVKHDSTSKIHLSWVFRPGNPAWLERCHQWYLHITIWEKLKQGHTQEQFSAAPNPVSTAPNPLSGAPDSSKKAILKATDKRIDVLFQHLGILDNKFGTLLTLNGLFILLPVYLMTSYVDKTRNPSQPVVPNQYVMPLAWVLFGLLLLMWGSNVFLCLISLRRIIWGNLGATVFEGYKPFDPIKPGFEDYPKIEKAENLFVKLLIMVVVDRSNNFRIAMVLQKWMAILLVLFFALAMFFWKDKAVVDSLMRCERTRSAISKPIRAK
jgi:hypothetical protein